MNRSHECNFMSLYNPIPEMESGFGQHELSVTGGKPYDFAIAVKTEGPVKLAVSLTGRNGKTVYDSAALDVNAADWKNGSTPASHWNFIISMETTKTTG